MKKGVSGDRNPGFFKKRSTIARPTLDVHITEEEATLAQSNYNVEKITEIQNRFTGGEILLVPGRVFIREGPLWKVCRKNVKKRQFFLFNDILVYGSIVAGRCNNQHILPLSKMSVSSRCEYTKDLHLQFTQEQLGEGLDMLNAFQVNHAEKSFHVVATSAADKSNWLSNLMKYIKKASQQDVAVETRAIWVPDSLAKDCMVCGTRFSAFIRKHHCRKCGRVVCSSCSPHRLELAPRGSFSTPTEERVCNQCFTSQNDHTHPAPMPQPAFTVSATPRYYTTASDHLNTSSLHDESTDTEDTDESGEEESFTPTEEALPSAKEMPQLATLHVSVPSASLSPLSVEEEKRPTPPPRRKRGKGNSEIAVPIDSNTTHKPGVNELLSEAVMCQDTIEDMKSLDLSHPSEQISTNEQIAGNEVHKKNRRKKKYFAESSAGSHEPLPVGNESLQKSCEITHESLNHKEYSSNNQGSNEKFLENNEKFLGNKVPPLEGQEPSSRDTDPLPSNQEPTSSDIDPLPGNQEPPSRDIDPLPSNQEPSSRDKSSPTKDADPPLVQKLGRENNDLEELVSERSSSPTRISSQPIEGSASTRKSGRRRQKFVVDHMT